MLGLLGYDAVALPPFLSRGGERGGFSAKSCECAGVSDVAGCTGCSILLMKERKKEGKKRGVCVGLVETT